MLDRRTLLSTLSAIVAAPLAKLLPPPEPQYVIGCDVAGPETSFSAIYVMTGSGIEVIQGESIYSAVDGVTIKCVDGVLRAIPQEEA